MNTSILLAPPDDELEPHRRAIRSNPRNAQAHAKLGVALQQRGQFEQAVASQRRALKLDPSLTGLHAVMAPALLALGQHQAAADSFRRALIVQKENAQLHKGLSEALHALGQLDAAVASARRAAALAAQDPDVHLRLAAALHALRDFPGAAASLRQALALRPGHLAARLDLGLTLDRLHRPEEAAACFRQALELDPDNFDAHLHLAACMRDTKQFAAALSAYQRALEIRPDSAVALRELGVALHASGEVEPAFASLHRALELAPGDTRALSYLAFIHFELGDWKPALDNYRRAMESAPDSPDMHSGMLFALSHCCHDPVELFAEHRQFGQRWDARHRGQPQPHRNARDPGRCLQVGFVSADLCNHAVATFIEPVFALLKGRPGLSLHAYSNNTLEDEVTERLRGHIDHWHSIVDLDDDAAERQIRADRIDILIDLSGHTARNRLPLFARRPAPVQASWIGYSCTTGLQAMDYFVADQFQLPEGRYDDQFTEQIVRLPLAAPFTPDPLAPPLNALPALANGYLTFGSFHRKSKLSREVIGQWAQLLRAVPDSRILLGGLTPGTEVTLLGWFDQEGIDRSRLLLRQRTTMPEYLAQHHEVDICLSPFPYTGATTVCHALWMGVPTLATIGPTSPSHGAACYLAHLGLSSFIADDVATFVQLGKFLSENLAELAALRAGMRERFVNSVVGYPGIAAASVEHAFRLMWQRWCAGLPPAPLRVRLADLTAAEQELSA